ncbi:MAG: ester cyclase [Chloroflexi bacterium]|nr:MAG: ester cyclase [Chloroflexota bacterium]
MSLEQNKAICRRVHDDVFEGGRLEVCDEIVAPDAQYHGPGFPPGRGPEVMKQDATIYRTAFRFDRLVRDLELAEGDLVTHYWTFTGTHVGDLGDIKPTGRQVTISGVDVFRLKDGRITDFYQQWDQMGMMQQLGVVPSAAPARA